MRFLEVVAAFFYLQPSLIITFVPLQIISLMICLVGFKKVSIFKAFFHAATATFLASILIFLIGFMVVPFIYVRFFQLVEISYTMSVFLFIISVFIYWLCISFYLHYIVKFKAIAQVVALSSAIAGLSVLTLYYLLWRK